MITFTTRLDTIAILVYPEHLVGCIWITDEHRTYAMVNARFLVTLPIRVYSIDDSEDSTLATVKLSEECCRPLNLEAIKPD